MQAGVVPANPLQIAITIGVVALIMLLRMRRMTRERRLRVEQLWIVPTILTALCIFVLSQAPPSLADMPWLIGAALIGAVIGWYRGKIMRISVDPETHAVNQSASPWAMLVLMALLVVRYGARFALGEESQAWHISLAVITDAPLMLAAGIFIVARVEMFLRARKLLQAARAAKARQVSE